MRRRAYLKDQQSETRLLLRRALVAAVGMLALVGVLLSRMVYLQVVNFQHYHTLSQENRVKLVPIPPNRGLIYDRNGLLLADNRPSFRLVLTPEAVKDIPDTLARLGEVIELSESDRERFRETLQRSRRFEQVPVKFRLTEAEVASLAVNRHRFPGVEVQAELARLYPWGDLFAHVVGYVGRINVEDVKRLEAREQLANYSGTSHIGKLGLEQYYEDVLHGRVGHEKVETNAAGRLIRVLERIPPKPGQDIYLSLDAHLQAAAEAALEEHSGAVVAIDPRSGEVLAFVSRPGYDPNLFVNGIDVASFRALQNNPARPLFNRALRGEYPPGSTIKPFVALAALETKTVTPQDTLFCGGHYTLPNVDHRFRDWKRGGHGRVDLNAAMAQSCDVYFYDTAVRMGIDNMSRILGEFGIGKPTGVDLMGERPGINPSREWKRGARGESWYHGETVIAGIGQGYMLTTPLQLAAATATLANKGDRIVPHLLRATRDPDTGEITPVAPARPAGPIQVHYPSMWDEIIETMHKVVTEGTASRIKKGASYTIAGKTGTAQVRSIAQDERYDASKLAKEHLDHGLFIAFAPVEAPEIAVAVIAENGGSGSGVAAPIARRVMDAYMEGKQRHAQ